MTDYTELNGPALLAAVQDDASRWAEAFCQYARSLYGVELDEDWVLGWFANAIEHSTDVRTGSGPTVLDDGSAFFVE